MTIILLFILLVIFSSFVYVCSKLHFLSPSFFVSISFLFSVSCCLLQIGRWDTNISIMTVLVIMCSLIVFFIGDMAGQNFRFKSCNSAYRVESNQIIQYSEKKLLFMIVVLIAINIAYFRYTYQLAALAGNNQGILGMFLFARYASNNHTITFEPSIFLSQGIVIGKVTAYIYTYIYLHNVIKSAFNKRRLILLLPAVSHLFNILLNTGRMEIINFIIYIMLTGVILMIKKRDTSLRINYKYVKTIVKSSITIFVAFTVMGTTTGKTQYIGIVNQIITYAGGSIIALDKYLLDMPEREFFGKETLRLMYTAISKLGFNTPEYDSYFLDFIQIGSDSSTNVYTAFRRYIQDYGYIGLIFCLFIIGFIFGNLYSKIIRMQGESMLLIIMTSYSYSLFMMPIDDCIIRLTLGVGTIYQLLYIFIGYYWIIKRENRHIYLKNTL